MQTHINLLDAFLILYFGWQAAYCFWTCWKRSGFDPPGPLETGILHLIIALSLLR